jgi:hypothetical protein
LFRVLERRRLERDDLLGDGCELRHHKHQRHQLVDLGGEIIDLVGELGIQLLQCLLQGCKVGHAHET